jgi:hypothetical protein
MSLSYIRVVNQQVLNRSILIDKVDRSQGNFSGYANRAKQKVYVPYVNPVDTAVKGYLDMVPTDEVLLSADAGTIKKLSTRGYVTFTAVAATLLATPVVTSASHAATNTTINGTTFLSVSPDITYVRITNLSSVTQVIPQSAFTTHTALQIIIPDAAVTIGTPGVGWKVIVQSNSRLSAQFTL